MIAEKKPSNLQTIDEVILKNTAFGSAPLVPEIQIRLLRDDSPLWKSFGDEPEADKIPRPYWAFAWSGGQALARYVLDHPEIFDKKHILDFAAGCGIASIAALKAGAERVTASEIDPISVLAITLNGLANNVKIRTVCADFIYSKNQGWNVILAGDILYNTRLARHGLNWLRNLAAEGVLVLIGDPGRTYSPSNGLKVLSTYDCRSIPGLEHPNLQKVYVYRLLPETSL